MMVMVPCFRIHLPDCRQEPAALPVSTNIYRHKRTVAYRHLRALLPLHKYTQNLARAIGMHIYLSLMHVSQAADDVELVIISKASVIVILNFTQLPTFEVKREC